VKHKLVSLVNRKPFAHLISLTRKIHFCTSWTRKSLRKTILSNQWGNESMSWLKSTLRKDINILCPILKKS